MDKEFIPGERIPLHEVRIVTTKSSPNGPWYRLLKVPNGWLYNFWNDELQQYNESWVFVPST